MFLSASNHFSAIWIQMYHTFWQSNFWYNCFSCFMFHFLLAIYYKLIVSVSQLVYIFNSLHHHLNFGWDGSSFHTSSSTAPKHNGGLYTYLYAGNMASHEIRNKLMALNNSSRILPFVKFQLLLAITPSLIEIRLL